MRLEQNGRATNVVLSRRNLLALLHKLDMEGSSRTLLKVEGDSVLTVQCEDDDVHYDRPEPVGVLHPETATFVAERSTA